MTIAKLSSDRMPLGPHLKFMEHTKKHGKARVRMNKMLETTRRILNDRLNPDKNKTPQAHTKNGNGHTSDMHALLFSQPQLTNPQPQDVTQEPIDAQTYAYRMTEEWIDDMDAYAVDPKADDHSASNVHLW